MKCNICNAVPEMVITHNRHGRDVKENICSACLADYVSLLLENDFSNIRINNLECSEEELLMSIEEDERNGGPPDGMKNG